MSATANDTTIIARFNPPCEGKAICYDRETGDYAMFLDHQYLGHAPTYHAAEQEIAAVYQDQLTHTSSEAADQDADSCLPFEPTQAEIAHALTQLTTRTRLLTTQIADLEEYEDVLEIALAEDAMYATEWDGWVATCKGEHVPEVVTLEHYERLPVLHIDLGEGISRATVLYIHREHNAAPRSLLRRCEAYELRTPDGIVALEMTDRHDADRLVGLLACDGSLDHHFMAAEWLHIATLVRNETVYTALQRWVAEDAALHAEQQVASLSHAS